MLELINTGWSFTAKDGREFNNEDLCAKHNMELFLNDERWEKIKDLEITSLRDYLPITVENGQYLSTDIALWFRINSLEDVKLLDEIFKEWFNHSIYIEAWETEISISLPDVLCYVIDFTFNSVKKTFSVKQLKRELSDFFNMLYINKVSLIDNENLSMDFINKEVLISTLKEIFTKHSIECSREDGLWGDIIETIDEIRPEM